MSADEYLRGMLSGDWRLLAATGGALLMAALLLAALLRRRNRGKLGTRVTAAATVLGLGWSAQGMWDTAVNHYGLNSVVASVLFVIFEAMLLARMLKAHQYRRDFDRRPKHVRAVWLIACVMALVVALGEGLAQAPARLAIPLLVAYGWYVDLTADDDPKLKPRTSLRWTPRRFALWAGILEAGERDARTIDRDRLRDRMTRLAFRRKHGSAWLSDLLNRATRLERLKTLADEADVTEVRSRLARSTVDLWAPPSRPASAPRLILPPIRQPAERKQGEHTRDGRTLRGEELRADAVRLMLDSVDPDHPRGMPTVELAARYEPPLKSRTAEALAAEARRQIPRPINGFPAATER